MLHGGVNGGADGGGGGSDPGRGGGGGDASGAGGSVSVSVQRLTQVVCEGVGQGCRGVEWRPCVGAHGPEGGGGGAEGGLETVGEDIAMMGVAGDSGEEVAGAGGGGGGVATGGGSVAQRVAEGWRREEGGVGDGGQAVGQEVGDARRGKEGDGVGAGKVGLDRGGEAEEEWEGGSVVELPAPGSSMGGDEDASGYIACRGGVLQGPAAHQARRERRWP